jgi:nucleotidyltransferase/DNA polymerase involved in DNA repair
MVIACKYAKLFISTWTRSMRRLSSGMIPNSAANLSKSRGEAVAPSSAPLPTRQDDLACVPQCRRLARNASDPAAVFLPPDFPRYRTVSRQVREIFKRHTDLIEPLSLDEAYLDVSENKTGLPTATQVARTIREQIRSELNLTASAGVAPNKFLAKIASDWRKPDGLFVIQPEKVDSFLLSLPVGRLPGVGKVTEEKLKNFQVQTVADLRDRLCQHSNGASVGMACVFTSWREDSITTKSFPTGRHSPSPPRTPSSRT